MRVFCKDDKGQVSHEPMVVKGRIYTVIEETFYKKESEGSYTTPRGTYYTLAEMGFEYAYHSSMFMPIEEDQQDETEFERNYKKELV